jgi:AraC-like DNA-binding protein
MVAIPPLLRYSTDDLPVRDRIPFWCEVFGRELIKLDFQAVAGRRFRQSGRLFALDGFGISDFDTDGVIGQRTKALLGDSNDSLIFQINKSGFGLASQLGRELKVEAREATLFAMCEIGAYHLPEPAHGLSLCIPRRTLASLVRDPESALLRRVPANTPALRLLVGYLDLVMEKPELKQAGLQQLFAAHVCDLVALAVGATRDATELAQARGLRAARLQAIKADIARRFHDESLSVTDVARHHGVTPRYVHMLFESEGRTFSEFLIEQRLTQAHCMLTDPHFAARTISAIAFEVGFANLSYFNRLFRRRYGASPSDIREAARSADRP